jgi:hypothetical protein
MDENKVVPPEELKNACVNVSIVPGSGIDKHLEGKTNVDRLQKTPLRE